MRNNRNWSALRLKKQQIYSQFDNAPKVRYKSCGVVRDWLDQWDHPSFYKPCRWKHKSWKKHRRTQYK